MSDVMKKISILSFFAVILISVVACSDEDNGALQNDLIKRTMSPLIVGEKINFAYAAGTSDSKLSMMCVEASVPGGEGTNFEPYAWHTENGVDKSEVVASDCRTEGRTSSAIIIDSQATTLRYYYVIPEEVRGKKVSFVFSTVSENGEKVSYRTPSYNVSAMDMRKLISLSGEEDGSRYFSIEDMKAYTKNEVISGNLFSKIDFIYAYAPKKNVNGNSYDYKHAFFAPAAEGFYPDDFVLPSGIEKKKTLMDKKLYVWDGQLKDDVNTDIYVDDLDLRSQTFENSVDYVLDIRAEGGVFMKTSDGKYAAYIYINSLDTNNKKAIIGIKRLRLE